MINIRPISDLRYKFTEIESVVKEGAPVYLTKNGYGSLVVMGMDYYERIMGKIHEASLVNRGIEDYEAGRVTDGKSSLKKLREKQGI